MALDTVRQSTWTRPLVGLTLFLLVGSSLWWFAVISRRGLALVVIGTISGRYILSLLSSDESRDSADDGSDSVWNAIPDRQYDGRHAESGGLTRGEQEQAITEIHEEAEQRYNESHYRRK